MSPDSDEYRRTFGEEFFHRLVDAIPSMVWFSRTDGHAFYLNEKWHELIGQTIDQSQGMGWLQVVHPDDRARLLDSIGRSLDDHNEFQMEIRYRMRSGNYHWHLEE